jgi:hypothetical protein
LRLNDDEIKQMQGEIDDEKELGLGLPVGVTNDVAQQQMLAQVPQQPQNPDDQQHQLDLQKAAQQQKKESVGTFDKLKQIL